MRSGNAVEAEAVIGVVMIVAEALTDGVNEVEVTIVAVIAVVNVTEVPRGSSAC